MTVGDLPFFLIDNYEIHEWSHDSAILEKDFSTEWNEFIHVLISFRLKRSEILTF